VSNDVVKVTNFVIKLFTNADWLPVLLVQQDPQLTHNREHKVFTHPPPEFGVEDGSVFRVGEDHEAVIGELLSDQGLVAFTDVKLTDISLDQGLEGLWTQEGICLREVHAREAIAAIVVDEGIRSH
jgi:hypothetical protein